MVSPRKNSGVSPTIVVVLIVFLLCVLGGLKLLRRHEPPPPSPRPVLVRPVKPQPAPPKQITGRIALVLDDWGYNKSHCRDIAALPGPAGIAILPHLPYSRDVIACAKAAGKEPMLHLPLEPYRHKEMFEEGYVLTTTMNPSALKKTLAKIIAEMPGVVGVNNHTGSKASEDEPLMTLVLSDLKRRKLFFVDSMTSDKSTGAAAAAKLGMRIARRDVFLDNRNEREAIEAQFAVAAAVARKNGYALAIGHDRALTLKIAAEQMKKLSAAGIEFIGVREYIKQNEYPGH